MKRKLSFLLMLVIVFTTISGSLIALAEDIRALNAQNPAVVDVDFTSDGKITTQSSLGTLTATEHDKAGNAANTTNKGIGVHKVKIGGVEYNALAAKSQSDTYLLTVPGSSVKTALINELANGYAMEAGFSIASLPSRERYVFGGTTAGGFGLKLTAAGELIYQHHTGSSYKNISLGTIALNEYHHFLANYDNAAKTITVYLDGQLKATVTDIAKFNGGGWGGNIMIFDTASTIASYQYSMTKGAVLTDYRIYTNPLSATESAAAYTNAVNEIKNNSLKINEAVIDVDFSADGTISTKSTLGTLTTTEHDKAGAAANTTNKGIGTFKVNAGGKKYYVNAAKSLSDSYLLTIPTSAYKSAIVAEMANGYSVEVGFSVAAYPTVRDGYIFGGTSGGGFGLKMSTAGELFYQHHNGSSYMNISLGTVSLNEYHHLVATYDDEADTVTLYYDGVLKATQTGVTQFKNGTWNGNVLIFDTSSTTSGYQYASKAGTVVTDYHLYREPLTASESSSAYAASLNKMTEVQDIIDLDFNANGTVTVAKQGLGTTAVKEYSNRNTALSDFPGVGEKIVKVGSGKYKVNAFSSSSASSFMEIATGAYSTALLSELNDGFTIETGFVIPSGIDTSRDRYILGATNGGGMGIKIAKTTGNLQFDIRDGGVYKSVSVARPEDNKYHHVMANYNAETDTMTLYVDGVLAGTTSGVTQVTKGSWNGNYNIMDTTSSIASYTYAMPAGTIVTDLHIYADVLSDKQCKDAYTAALNAMTPYTPEDIIDLDFNANGTVTVAKQGLGTTSVKEYSNRNTALSDFPGVGEQIIKVGTDKYTVNAFKSSLASSFMEIGTGEYATDLLTELNDGFTIETGFVIPKGIDTSRDRYIVGATNGGGMGIKIAKTTGNLQFDIRDGGVYKSVSVARPEDNKYHHVMANYNAETDTMTLYVDGVLVGTTSGVTQVTRGSWNGNYNIMDTTSSIASYTYAMPAGTIVTDLRIYADSLTDEQCKNAYTAAINAMTPYVKVYDDDFEPVLRFMVTSDIHIGKNDDNIVRSDKFAAAINSAYNIAEFSGNHYETLDLIAVAGDLAENGKVSQLQTAKQVADTYIDYDETEFLVTTGNHEYYDGEAGSVARFESVFGDGSANSAVKVNGYWFIGVSSSSDGFSYTAKDVKFMEEALKVAAADDPEGKKPIFVFQHIGNINTVFGTDTKSQYPGLTTFDALYSQYPQVVNFSGHTHHPINDEASIHQKNYTNLSTGTLYYTTMAKYNNVSPTVVGGSIYDIAQYYIVEVDASNRTRIRVYDFNQNKFVGETYLLESYKPEDFTYNESRIADKEIFFASDAKINITKATQNLAVFEFTPVAKDSFTARNYKIVVEDMQGNEVASRYVSWLYYDEDYETMLPAAISGLEPDTEYTLKIYGVNSMYLVNITDSAKISTTPLTTTFKTAAVPETVVADLMDIKVDSAADTVTDVSGNDLTLSSWGTPKTGYDATIGMDYVSFDGSSNIKISNFLNDKEDMIYGFTYEGYFKVDDFSNCEEYSRGVMAMEHSGGFGFDIYKDKTCNFSVYTNGYKSVTKTLEEGKYYHWVCVYNGEELVCYINGHRMSAVPAEVPVTFLADTALNMFLGGDTTAAGGWERLSETSIAISRLYSGAMSEAQALELWEDVRALQDPALYPDDSDDPEYLRWESIDDDQTEYVTFYDTKGNVHDHAIDENSFDVYPMNGGNVSYFIGSHYYNGSSHVLDGDVRSKLSFTGTAFRYIVRFRGPADEGYGDAVDVYIDGEYYTTVTGLNGPSLTTRAIMLEVLDLEDKKHEITFVSHNGMRVLFDEFQVVFGEGKDDDGGNIPQVPVEEAYVKDVAYKSQTAPKLDGVISEKEWGKPIIVSNPAHSATTWTEGFWSFDPASVNGRQVAKVYLTADDEYIYIGATLDKSELDSTCHDAGSLYKAAHFNFSLSNWNNDTTVERIPFEGETYEQYTGFMMGLVNGNKSSFTFTQGLDAWELPAEYFEVKYDAATKTYTYEAKVPINRTNIASDKIALSASLGTTYTAGEATNRYNFTTGASTCGGASKWAHLDNALPVSIEGLIEKAEEPFVGKLASATNKAPKLDGVINENEWGNPVIVSNPTHASETWDGGFWSFDPSSVDVNQNAKVYITSDKDYLYVGATLDKCMLDETCTNVSELYKSAHFNFTVSNWNNDTTVERIPFEGDDYEQYTGFMFGLVNGKKASYTFTQGLAAWELPAEYYEIKYDEATRTYTYEAKIPFDKTNIVSDKIAFSASIGAPYTGGDAANRYNFTTGASTCGGAYNWAHLNNALAITLPVIPNTSDNMNAFAVIAVMLSSVTVLAVTANRKRKAVG